MAGTEMRSSSITRERGHWPRSLILAGLLIVGTACGGTAGSQAGDRSAAVGRAGETPADTGGQQPVLPSPLGQTPTADAIAGRGPRPRGEGASAPDLGTQPPVAPPNTVSLEELHRQGRTHVLR